CLQGPNAVVLNYIRSAIEEAVVLRPESDYAVGPLRFSTSPRHRHALETYGIIFKPEDGPQVGFLVDTEYFEELADAYRGVDVLVVNVVRHTPYPDPKVMHLSADDARRVIAGARPGKAVLTHFGMDMLRAEPDRLAAELTEETGVEVIAATDGMTLPLDADHK
ncbi:MAG: MBL fold metallo-hydrolase, partial [Candidatus Brocadiaceae bacterium]